MLTEIAERDARLSRWRRVREFAVPSSMIRLATARRRVGDWAGACAAARVDVDLNLRLVARAHGRELAARLRADLRHLAPDLLRWHMPRIAPDGLLRPGLTVALARYDPEGNGPRGAVSLVVRTPPAWADAGQRMSLALWAGPRPEARPCRYPHPHPDRRFRLDLHRHLWDARRAGELPLRCGAGHGPAAPGPMASGPMASGPAAPGPAAPGPAVPAMAGLRARGCAVGRWADEAAILLRAEGRASGTVAVRLGGRHRMLLHAAVGGDDLGPPALRMVAGRVRRSASALPVLPDAATWVLPDLELLHNGLIEVDRLHPLVASALAPAGSRPAGPPPAADHAGPPPAADRAGGPRPVECRGELHRIGLVDGALTPLDHDPAEIRREGLLAALTGTPLPCLRAIDQAHRHPECLTDVRARLDHGDIAGALAVVEGLLGPGALLRAGTLRDELEAAARRRITYGLFRAGLAEEGARRARPDRRRTGDHRAHPREATPR